MRPGLHGSRARSLLLGRVVSDMRLVSDQTATCRGFSTRVRRPLPTRASRLSPKGDVLAARRGANMGSRLSRARPRQAESGVFAQLILSARR